MERKAVIVEKSIDRKRAHIRAQLIPKGYDMAACKDCRVVYKGSRWFYDDDLYKRSINKKSTNKITCSACIKVHDNYPDGIIIISGRFLLDRIDEIKQMALKEEQKEKNGNPFNRIVNMSQDGENYMISFTEHKFAEKIAKSIHRAYKAELSFDWSEDEDFVQITCRRP